MKLLYWEWKSFLKKGVERAFDELKLDWDRFSFQLDMDWEHNENFKEAFGKALDKAPYDAVFSINYNPMISDICEQKGIAYYSWIYDSPIHIRDLSSLNNSCNCAFFFDREQVEAYKKAGYDVNYLTLAGDVPTFEASIKKNPGKAADIAFVGQLYQTDYAYYMSPLSDYRRGFMEAVVESQRRLYGGYILPEILSDEVMDGMNQEYLKASNGKVTITERELEYMLACEATSRDRFDVLSALSMKYDVSVYTSKKDERLINAKQYDYVDYYDRMPGIFASAKINLNISLKCIRSGIPLRVFDILSCGGFLITNYQSELYEYFEPGKELVVYSDIEEVPALCDYYLKNETEREYIAVNGHRRVSKEYTVEAQLRKILY